MKSAKRTFLRVFFGVEVIIFSFMYLFGAQGMRVLYQLRRESVALGQEVENLSGQVSTLEKKLVAWESDSFYKEKIARERLHMANKNDVIFYLK
jgi:cell division protein FtsB